MAFLSRLFDSTDTWSDAHALIVEFCQNFDLSAAGFAWPSPGASVIFAETAFRPANAIERPVAVPGQPNGLLWAAVTPATDKVALDFAAKCIGHSPAFRRLLGPYAEQGRIAERLADAAKVAGRVAHDLDNVFQGVTGFQSLAMDLLEPESMAYQNIREAENAARAGMKFCVQLHELSRGGQARPLPSSLGSALARESARLTKAGLATHLTIDTPGDLPAVAVEGGVLQLMLSHLLDNAVEANPKEPVVAVATRPVELHGGDLPAYLGCPAAGSHVEVRIRDNGPGLAEDAVRRMFVEPFYTTKLRHRGLGLTVVYRMVYAHRGGVRVDSRPGQGTTISLVLPVVAARVPAVEPTLTTGGTSR